MLAVAGGKGGCGKTTTALGVAAAMARGGSQPLVVDCDCDMPDLHHVADVDREPGVSAIAEGGAIEDVAQRTVPSNPGRSVQPNSTVRVVTAGHREHVGPALARLQSWPGPVLLDTPAGVTPEATRPLSRSDRVLLVTQPTPQCLDDTARTATVAHELGVDCAGVVVRHRGNHQEATTFDCQGRKIPVLGTVPTVEGTPFDDPRVRAGFRRIASRLPDIPDKRADNGRYTACAQNHCRY